MGVHLFVPCVKFCEVSSATPIRLCHPADVACDSPDHLCFEMKLATDKHLHDLAVALISPHVSLLSVPVAHSLTEHTNMRLPTLVKGHNTVLYIALM